MAQTILVQGPIAMGSLTLSTDAPKTHLSSTAVLLPALKHRVDKSFHSLNCPRAHLP